jgi:hypothetical protein
MPQCPEIVLDAIDPEKYQALIVKACAQGLNLSGECGSTTFQDMNFTWAYDSAAQTLTIQCTERPFFIPCSMLESRIRGLVS